MRNYEFWVIYDVDKGNYASELGPAFTTTMFTRYFRRRYVRGINTRVPHPSFLAQF